MRAQKRPVRLSKWLGIVSAVLGGISEPSYASILTVTCEDPEGFHVEYGENMLKGQGIYKDAWRAARFGSKPTFLIDSTRPDRMFVIWGSGVPREIPEVIIKKWLPTKAEEFQIISQDEDQVTAIQVYPGGVAMYSLYPKLEYGVFTEHREWATEEEHAAAWIYYGRCTFAN